MFARIVPWWGREGGLGGQSMDDPTQLANFDPTQNALLLGVAVEKEADLINKCPYFPLMDRSKCAASFSVVCERVQHLGHNPSKSSLQQCLQ